MKVRQWRNRDRWVWCQGTSWAQRKSPRKIRMRGIKSWIRVLFHEAPGNWCETTTKTQQHILKSGNKMTLHLGAPGHWCKVVRVQGAPGNWCEVMTIKLKGQTDILGKSSRTCDKSWISQKRHQYSTWRPPTKAFVHLRPNYNEHLEVYRNTNFGELKNLFDITQKMDIGTWSRDSQCLRLIGKSLKWTKAEVHVNTDSVSCFEKMQDHSGANQRWTAQLAEFQQSNSYRIFLVRWRTDWVRVAYFPGLASLEIFQKIQKNLQDQNIEPQHCEGRIIFMSMLSDIGWTKKGNSENCIQNSEQVKNYAKRFSRGHWSFQGPGEVENGTERTPTNLKENAIPSQKKKMWDISKETAHPVFKGVSALNRGILKRKGGRCTIHFNAGSSNTELFVSRTSLSKSAQYWCEELTQRDSGSKRVDRGEVRRKRERTATKNVKPQEVNSLVHTPWSKDWASGNRLREQLQRFAAFVRRVSIWMSCHAVLDVGDGFVDRSSACRELSLPREDPNSRIDAMIPEQTAFGPVLQVHITRYLDISEIEIQIPSTTGEPILNPGWWYPEVKIGTWKSRLNDPDPNPASSELLELKGLERSTAKKREPSSSEMEVSWSREETHANRWKNSDKSMWTIILKKLFPGKRGQGMIFLSAIFQRKYFFSVYKFFKGNISEAEVSKLVMRLVRRYDQDERESDDAVHWNSMVPKLRKAFQKAGGHKFSDSVWLQQFYEGRIQDEVPVLHEFQIDIIVYSCYSRTHWWKRDCAWIDGSCGYSIQMERILVSPWMLLWCHFNPQVRTDSWRKRE